MVNPGYLKPSDPRHYQFFLTSSLVPVLLHKSQGARKDQERVTNNPWTPEPHCHSFRWSNPSKFATQLLTETWYLSGEKHSCRICHSPVSSRCYEQRMKAGISKNRLLRKRAETLKAESRIVRVGKGNSSPFSPWKHDPVFAYPVPPNCGKSM